jgi:hypothetical protein
LLNFPHNIKKKKSLETATVGKEKRKKKGRQKKLFVDPYVFFSFCRRQMLKIKSFFFSSFPNFGNKQTPIVETLIHLKSIYFLDFVNFFLKMSNQ